MTINRRGFLAGSTALAAGAGLGCATQAAAVTLPPPPREAVLKLSSQLPVIPGKELAEKLAFMEKVGPTATLWARSKNSWPPCDTRS